MTLRARLLLLMLAVLLPTTALFVWIVAATYQRETESGRQRLRDTARALSLVVDRELDKRAGIARTLASSPAIAQGDLHAFYEQARAATRGSSNWIVLVDNDDQLLNTSVPFGTPLPKRRWTPDRPIASADSPQVTNLRIGPVSKKPVLAVFAADQAFTPTRYNVGVVFTPAALQEILGEQRLPAGWIAEVADREHSIVARTPDADRWRGQKLTPGLVDALNARAEGFIDSMSLDDVNVAAFFSRSPLYGWTFVIGVPQQAMTAAARRAAWEAAAAAALLSVFAIALATWVTRRIRRPIEMLEQAARQLGNDEVPQLPSTGLVETDAVGAALHRAGLQAAQATQELERRVAVARDEARQAQARSEELQRIVAEELLRLITDHLPVLISYIDTGGHYRLNNRAYETWFARPRSEITGRHAREVVGEATWNTLSPFLWRAVAGESLSSEQWIEYPGVGGRWVEVSYIPHRAPSGTVEGVAVLVHDVSERRRAHEELQRTEESQRLLVQLHDATHGLHDAAEVQRRIVDCVGRHFGVSRCAYGEIDAEQQVVTIDIDHTEGVTSLAGYHRLDEFGAAVLAELKAGRTVIVNDVHADPRTADPSVCSTLDRLDIRALVGVPLLKGGCFVALLMLQHLEPRAFSAGDAALLEQVAQRTWFAVEAARSESALRESRDVLSLAMRSGRMGAWSRDVLSNSVWWSRELEEIFGLEPGAFAGVTDAFRSLVHPEDEPRLAAAVAQALEGHDDYTVEFRFKHASGEWRWMEGRGRAVYGPDGRPTMVYGLGIDISERKRAEDELRRLNAELSDADRRKDEFLATLAHELRNPLAPITNAIEILRLKDPEDAQLRWTRDIIDRQVRQMSRLVDDLLDVARITRGKIELRRERIAISTIVQGAIEAARPLIDASGHRLDVSLPDEPVWVDADPMRLMQVLLNLLNNAVKYTPPGGRIAVTASADAGGALITVRDSGIGIAPEHLSGVFEMFSQVAPALERSQGGLGIGLALARGLMDLHGGAISARSAGSGQGSEFTVRLPLAVPPHSDDAAPGTGAGATAVPARKVLVVDDNRDAADSLAAILKLNGHEVETRYDGEDALARVAGWQPDVVLLDIGMPGLNGYEVAERLRRAPYGTRTLLVALTGWGQEDDKRRAIAAGFDHHLTKPVDPARLDAVMQAGTRSRIAPEDDTDES